MSKVMLIEDDVTMVSLLQILLSMEGYDVVCIEHRQNLEGMLSELHRQMPALVILDVNLQGLNGFELLQKIRTDESLKSMQVIMASGMDVRERSERAGANGFIQKPYMPEELISRIRKTLGTD